MNKFWKIIAVVTISVAVLGLVCFGAALVLGADLVRIADVVFGKYDLAQTILNFRAFFSSLLWFI